jgi:hypothetical protein
MGPDYGHRDGCLRQRLLTGVDEIVLLLIARGLTTLPQSGTTSWPLGGANYSALAPRFVGPIGPNVVKVFLHDALKAGEVFCRDSGEDLSVFGR